MIVNNLAEISRLQKNHLSLMIHVEKLLTAHEIAKAAIRPRAKAIPVQNQMLL